jgi:hypothetical protein
MGTMIWISCAPKSRNIGDNVEVSINTTSDTMTIIAKSGNYTVEKYHQNTSAAVIQTLTPLGNAKFQILALTKEAGMIDFFITATNHDGTLFFKGFTKGSAEVKFYFEPPAGVNDNTPEAI